MKNKAAYFVIIVWVLSSAVIHAQDIDNIKKYGYGRLGIGWIGRTLSPDLTPLENARNGNFGAGLGFTLEAGRQFYLHQESLTSFVPMKVGLEWNFFEGLNKYDWNGYYRTRNPDGSTDPEYDGLIMLTGMGVGPVLSINPWELFIVDIHVRVMGMISLYDLDYVEGEGTAAYRYLNYSPVYDEEGDDSRFSHFMNYLGRGIVPSFGLTFRRKGWGLAFSHLPGKIRMRYESDEGNGMDGFPIRSTAVMLSLSF
ncbi:hypothetical protein [Parapedobacter koreensis]|uniref:Outer membrane protein beta-barrel domain-containing protein n=1 Tax=Parapedobacter koreensis TaxID=332977 RepID=A0A1H7NLK4_9SPHI|nr:hypothetical protein [Parapedobacter koreensis]SEL24241.1 hypothetical protein SAMN05421740_10428 [Parapedobacter koreensis]